jgi:WhiB family transcriptional regulator, redox-sensing transcriptional regulator
MSNLSRLPGPFADVWDWQRNGACRGRDSAQFFHPDGERGASRTRREVAAKAVCRTCPVRAECAAHALAAKEPYGVWGGFTEAERLRLLAAGWEDLSDRVRGRVDVHRLEARLGLGQRHLPAPRREPTPGFVPAQRVPVTPH